MYFAPMSDPSSTWAKKVLSSLKWILKIGAVAGIVLVAIYLGRNLEHELMAFDQWIKSQGAWAPLLFTMVVVTLPLIAFPTDLITFSAGALFGLWPGLFYSCVGLVASASIAYVIGRYLARNTMNRWFKRHPKFNAAHHALKENESKVMFLLRMTPLPFAPLNYFFGASQVPYKTYLITISGTFSTIFAGVYFGYLAQHITKLAGKTSHHTLIHEILIFSGFVFTVIALAYITYLARKTLKTYQVS